MQAENVARNNPKSDLPSSSLTTAAGSLCEPGCHGGGHKSIGCGDCTAKP